MSSMCDGTGRVRVAAAPGKKAAPDFPERPFAGVSLADAYAFFSASSLAQKRVSRSSPLSMVASEVA